MHISLPGVPVESVIYGLDLSLTATGWAILRDGRDLSFGTIQVSSKGPQRLAEIEDMLFSYLGAATSRTSLAAIEGYAFGSQMAHSLGELGGIVKTRLWRQGTRQMLVPPQTLKKFVLGKGSGEKGHMMVALFKQWGVEAPDNNAADACLAAIMGYHWMCPDMTLPAYRQDSLRKVQIIDGQKPQVRRRTRPLQLVAST